MRLDFSQLNDAELVFMILIALLLLFAGYRIKKIAFFIIWFFVGVNLMGYIVPEINKTIPGLSQNDFMQALLPVAGGLLMALMGLTIEKICLGGIVFAITLMITAQYFGTEMQTLLIGAVIGVVLAGASVMLMKPAVIISTSIAGAYLILPGIFHWVTDLDPVTLYFPLLLGITAVGAVTQFITTRRE